MGGAPRAHRPASVEASGLGVARWPVSWMNREAQGRRVLGLGCLLCHCVCTFGLAWVPRCTFTNIYMLPCCL